MKKYPQNDVTDDSVIEYLVNERLLMGCPSEFMRQAINENLEYEINKLRERKEYAASPKK